MITKKLLKYFPILLLFIFQNNSADAQIRISSPYSYYGLGDMQRNQSAYNAGMGGIKNAIRSPFYINAGNPASYTALDTNSFIFDIGLNSSFNQLRSEGQTQEFTSYTSVSNVLFAFPVSRSVGISAGLLPYSRTGYAVVSRDTFDNIGIVKEIFEGSGGINKVYVGTGVKIFKDFSAGINLGYLFGTTYKNTSITIPDLPSSYNIRARGDEQVSGIYLDYGIQYKLNVKKKYAIVFGTKFNLPMNVKATRNQIVQRYTASGIVESIKDTLKYVDEEKGHIYMPFGIGGGLTFSDKKHWLVGVDFDWQNWENLKSFDVEDSLKNSFAFAIGGEFIPGNTVISPYWQKVGFRLGFHYNQTYLALKGKNIDEFGVAIGIGLPVSKLYSVINFTLEAGKRGSINSGLIQENFIRMTFGFSFREFWFYRPKLQ